MTPEQAIGIISRQRPCEHENHDTRLGDGTTWAKCDDCGVTFARDGLQRRRGAVDDFDEAIEALSALVERPSAEVVDLLRDALECAEVGHDEAILKHFDVRAWLDRIAGGG